jgi:recombination associated protein RdgC
MLKSAVVYRVKSGSLPTAAALEEVMDSGRFVAAAPTQAESHGWVEPRGEKHGPLCENVGGQLILKLKSEHRAVPSGAVKEALDARLDKVEQETGRRPKGKHAKEIKEEIVFELLPRAFSKIGSTTIWVDRDAGYIVLGATSAKKADRIITLLVETFSSARRDDTGEPLRFDQVSTQMSPETAMAAWLTEKEAPAGFSTDRECELKQPDSEKAAVKYSRHTLDIEEIGEHIKQGKLPTKLALTWDNRVSFVLTKDLGITKIAMLDVVVGDSKNATGGKDSSFDADVAIFTGEMAKLLPDLFEALGGVLELGDAQALPDSATGNANAASKAEHKDIDSERAKLFAQLTSGKGASVEVKTAPSDTSSSNDDVLGGEPHAVAA